VCICSLRYPTCNAHAPDCHLWPVSLYNTFSHCLINGTIFERVMEYKTCISTFSLRLLSETILILSRTERDMAFMYNTLYSCPISMKLEFSRQFFEDYSNIKFHENPSSRSRTVPCAERTDMTKLLFTFRNFAKAPKNRYFPHRYVY